MHTTRAIVAALLVASSPAWAQSVDFETTPASVPPVDDALLVSPYMLGGTSVQFGFDTNDDLTIDAFPRFEARGGGIGTTDGAGGYLTGPTDNLANDLDLTGAGIGGSWMIRRPDIAVNPVLGHDFLIVYSGAFPSSASGQVWDLDGFSTSFERWRVDAISATGSVLATQESPFFTSKQNPPVESRDGWPWSFSFVDVSAPIHVIRISWTGSLPSGIQAGFAFDNFDATSTTASCSFRNGNGVNPAEYSCTTTPVIGTAWLSSIVTVPTTIQTVVALGLGGPSAGVPSPFGTGELLIGLAPAPALNLALGTHSVGVPADAAIAGLAIPSQGFRVDLPGTRLMISALNAQDLTLGF